MVNDGRGHRARANIEIAEDLKPSGTNAVQTNGLNSPGWVEVLAGLSILLNIVLIPRVVKR